MAELADAMDSKSIGRKGVWVQLPPPAFQSMILVIAGPTAVGKSALAMKIAKEFNGEIISADSRQVYRGLDIGTGKITKREMQSVPHHLLNVANPRKQFSAAEYARLAQEKIADISARGKFPIIVGGTGHYIDVALGRVTIPDVSPNPELRKRLEKNSAEELFALLQQLAPARAATIDRHNPRRLVRAIEIAQWQNSLSGSAERKLASAAGASTRNFLAKKYPCSARHFPNKSFASACTCWIGLKLSPQALRQKIAKRLAARMRRGLVAEVKRLHTQGVSWKRMDELGLEYRFVSRFLRELMTKNEMIAKLQTEIYHYAKRQMTWFKKNTNIHWFQPSQEKEIFGMLKSALGD